MATAAVDVTVRVRVCVCLDQSIFYVSIRLAVERAVGAVVLMAPSVDVGTCLVIAGFGFCDPIVTPLHAVPVIFFDTEVIAYACCQ